MPLESAHRFPHARQQQSPRSWKKPLLIGLIFTVVQFGLSEICYQLSISLPFGETTDALTAVSNFVAWPAEWIYMSEEATMCTELLTDINAHPGDYPEGFDAKARELLQAYDASGDRDALITDTYQLADENNIDIFMPLWKDYVIYGGTCIAWGTLIALLVYFIQNPASAQDYRRRMP